MTLLLTRALKRAQREYRDRLADLAAAESRYNLRKHQAGIARQTPLTPEVVLIGARILRESGYQEALDDCVSAEQVLLEVARTYCESKGFERLAEAGGLHPDRLALVFKHGPKTRRVRAELVRICLAI